MVRQVYNHCGKTYHVLFVIYKQQYLGNTTLQYLTMSSYQVLGWLLNRQVGTLLPVVAFFVYLQSQYYILRFKLKRFLFQ